MNTNSVTPIEWHALAQRVDPHQMFSPSVQAGRAISSLLGDDALIDAVDCCTANRPGALLARHVLEHLRPERAMFRCRELIQVSADAAVRENASELLRDLADARALAWIPSFLADPQPGVQFWGFLVVDQLLYRRYISLEDAEPVLAAAAASVNEEVREQAAAVRARHAARSDDEP
jgi:hypothetical protein